jgi:urease gamma subunit
MKISRPAAVGTLVAVALAGGLGGALLLGPVSAGPASTSGPGGVLPAAAARAGCGEGFAEVAEAIGITTDELRAGLRDGQTLAEVAEAAGGDPQEVVDVLVAKGTKRLDAAVAAGRLDRATADQRVEELPARASELVDGRLERSARRHPRAVAGLRTAAEAIGIPAEDLRAALRDGRTIAQVAEEHGIDPQVVVDALVARSTGRITRVVDGETARQRC